MTVTQPHGDVYTIGLYSQDFIGEICGQRKKVMILQKEEKKEGGGKSVKCLNLFSPKW